ncbi:MAG: [Alphaproteobacteria bacterium]|nr:[FeFe] hydrogenase H-cluster maturation GTPase HydF [Alphaproteobacteria bacterium]
MNTAPKSIRLQIAIMGKVNSGKSSFLNLINGQDIAITSPEAGTTTDIVEKNQELFSLGPVTWLDTAGLGDNSELGELRQEKTKKIFERADIILLILSAPILSPEEESIIEEAIHKKIPLIKIYNKADTYTAPDNAIAVNSLDVNSRSEILNKLTAELLKICPEEFIKTPPILGDLVPPHSTIVMITPIDYEAPKGRLILPQVQSIRDALDFNNTIIIVKEDAYKATLENLKNHPDLVICDSQVVDKMVAETPDSIPCTTFSTLFARLKGDINILAAGAATITELKDGDKVLIAEACTHHAMEDDIGKVKIPNLLRKKTGKNLQIDFAAGHDFPNNLSEYKLVIQCGGCMFGRKEILNRINNCCLVNVPITNYGICISELKGVLERILAPFPTALETYKRIKK